MTQNQRTVLIIDDCLEDRQTYRRYLLQDSSCTYTILEEEYGEDGLELCQLAKPDAILLDFLLPDIDGIEFLNELKTKIGKSNLPVVMLTGQGNEAIAVAAIKNGASDYLSKGNTTPESLRLAIHKVVEQAQWQCLLEQTIEQFHTSIENVLDCFGIYKSIRSQTGQIIDFLVEYVNPAACTHNQTTQSEQIGKRLLESLPLNQETTLFADFCQVVETGESVTREVLHYAKVEHKQSLTKALDIRVAKLGDGCVATWRDITKHKHIEERLQLIESIVVSANDAVLVTTTTPLEAPGPYIVYVNEAFAQMTGYSPQEVLGKSPRLLQGANTDQATIALMRAALQAKESLEVEIINYRKDGSEFWAELSISAVADATGEYIYFVAIQRDITERKHREIALQQSQQLMQRIADSAPDLLYLYDWQEQQLVYVNRQLVEVLGYTPAAICQLGTSLSDLIHPDDLPQLTRQVTKFRSAEDGEIVEFACRVKHQNHQWRWFLSRNTVFAKAADGSPQQILGTGEDITQQRQQEAERHQLLIQAQAATAAAEAVSSAKDQFLSMVAHELRNPIHAILGYVQFLQTPNLSEASITRGWKTIEECANLQTQLIDDLLDISRITSGKLRLDLHLVDLVTVIESAIITISLAAQAKAIGIELVVASEVASVYGDAQRLQQVILNLLSNAVKFTPEGGDIQVQLKRLQDWMQISVIDTGCGIEAELLPQIFKQFCQANSIGRQGGLGLGLAIARHIVELHHGTIQAASPGEGQGATFTIKLPIHYL